MRKLKLNSLRWQLLSRFFLILLILLIGMEVFLYETMKQYLYQSKEQILDARFHNMDNMKIVQTSKDVVNNAKYIINLTIDANMSAAVIDVQGNQITSESRPPNGDEKFIQDDDKTLIKHLTPISVPKLSKEEYMKLFKEKGTLEGYRLVKDSNNDLQIVGFRKLGRLDSPVGLIQLSITAKPVQDTLYSELSIYIIASTMTLIIGGFVGALVFKYTLKPLYNMTNTLEEINIGQLDVRLPVENRQLEIDRLSKAFNSMLERLEEAFNKEQIVKEKMRLFVSDASHELRTPLTSIHGFVEVLLRGAAKSEEQLNSALKSILMESERLTKLVNDLLLLTRLDRKAPQEMKDENINSIIEEILPQLKILAGDRSIELELSKKMYAYVNKNHIKQIIFNMVQNAVSHTEEHGVIKIIVDRVKENLESYVVIKIIDNGTGIKKEHLEKIFDRFYRSEEHRARKFGGYGLGLSIVKSIVDEHEGKIEVESEIGKGTKFLVYLKEINK